jgi:hypothetical protein
MGRKQIHVNDPRVGIFIQKSTHALLKEKMAEHQRNTGRKVSQNQFIRMALCNPIYHEGTSDCNLMPFQIN